MSASAIALPDSIAEDRGYRLKRSLLGRPLDNDDLEHEKLSNPLALGVLSSDCISSSAYGTEEILHALIPALGLTAYSLLLPVTGVVIAVLVIVTMTYRQVVQIYTDAGGSYVVARDNFGPLVAQVGAVALMLDYIVTVAVQAAAGTAAVTSALPSLQPYAEEITVGVVLILAYGNLRGLREAGRAFAFPTYFFAGAMVLVIGWGLLREIIGDLPVIDAPNQAGAIEFGSHQGSLLTFGVIYVLLRAFAQGGSSLTGLEAISNGVSTFNSPRGLNARRTLVRMSVILGILVAGVSWLAHVTHAVPYADGSPTVISQVAKAVFPDNAVGTVLFFTVQLATMLILYTGANTPFNGFPYLANFVAADGFLPRWLRKRGHRLAFSNGIFTLAVIALTLILTVGAHVDKLVAFYAIGVFTGFTLAGFGMAHYHRVHPGPHQRRSIALNTLTGVVSGVVVVVFFVTKFHEGAWLVGVMFVVLVPMLFRLHRVYERERKLLAADTGDRGTVLSTKNVVVVLVDTMDLAVLGALRHARSLKPSKLRCVHFVVDTAHAKDLQRAWDQRATDLSLELIECPDRRLGRAAYVLTRGIISDDPRISLTVLIPRRGYGSIAGMLLHDRTGDVLAAAVTRVPGAAAMIVPFDASAQADAVEAAAGQSEVRAQARAESFAAAAALAPTEGAAASAAPPSRHRRWVELTGRIHAVEQSAIAGSPTLRVQVRGDDGVVTAVFLGQRDVVGLDPGRRIRIEGRLLERRGERFIANPAYTLLPGH